MPLTWCCVVLMPLLPLPLLLLPHIQADSTLPVEHRRNYKGVVDAMVSLLMLMMNHTRLLLLLDGPHASKTD